MITCHESLVALIIADVISHAIYANYYIKLSLKSLELRQRTKELEKKNGHEQHQINAINSLLDSSNQQINQLKAEVAKLKSKP